MRPGNHLFRAFKFCVLILSLQPGLETKSCGHCDRLIALHLDRKFSLTAHARRQAITQHPHQITDALPPRCRTQKCLIAIQTLIISQNVTDNGCPLQQRNTGIISASMRPCFQRGRAVQAIQQMLAYAGIKADTIINRCQRRTIINVCRESRRLVTLMFAVAHYRLPPIMSKLIKPCSIRLGSLET